MNNLSRSQCEVKTDIEKKLDHFTFSYTMTSYGMKNEAYPPISRRQFIKKTGLSALGCGFFANIAQFLPAASEPPVPPQPRAVRLDWAPESSWMGREIYEFGTVGSTNDIAHAWGSDGRAEGLVALAEAQTGGRGRWRRTWYSPQNRGLYMSLLARPKISLQDSLKITLAAGVAAAESLQNLTGVQTRLKWPNDILMNGRKIGGILCELSTDGTVLHWAVAGLGVNLTGQEDDFPPELRASASSVHRETGRVLSKKLLVLSLLKNFESTYQAIPDDWPAVFRRWNALSQMAGRRVRIATPEGALEGRVAEFLPDGRLRLILSNGESQTLTTGDLTVLDDPWGVGG